MILDWSYSYQWQHISASYTKIIKDPKKEKQKKKKRRETKVNKDQLLFAVAKAWLYEHSIVYKWEYIHIYTNYIIICIS